MNPIRGNPGNSLPAYLSAVSPSTPGIGMVPASSPFNNQGGGYFQFPMGRGSGQVHRHQADTGSGDVRYHVGGNQFYFNEPGNYNLTIEYRQPNGFGARATNEQPAKEAIRVQPPMSAFKRPLPPCIRIETRPRSPTPAVVGEKHGKENKKEEDSSA